MAYDVFRLLQGGRSYKQIHLDKIRRRDGINRSLSTTYPGRENGEDSPGNAPMSDRGKCG